MPESLQLRVHHPEVRPALVHLPGLHGDWTLLGPFRRALGGRACLVETTYPRRPDWRLDDYAAAMDGALAERGLREGWVLAESFSSQVGWQWVARQLDRPETTGFRLLGLILVGGFIRHSWPWGVRACRLASAAGPPWLRDRLCSLYTRGPQTRDPAGAEDFREFVRRRLVPADRDAITQRYRLIADTDLRPVARRARLPVYHLSGAWDPLVPWPLVRAWLRRECPGYRASRIVRQGGHNVLLSAADISAEQILEWVTASPSTAPLDRPQIRSTS